MLLLLVVVNALLSPPFPSFRYGSRNLLLPPTRHTPPRKRGGGENLKRKQEGGKGERHFSRQQLLFFPKLLPFLAFLRVPRGNPRMKEGGGKNISLLVFGYQL